MPRIAEAPESDLLGAGITVELAPADSTQCARRPAQGKAPAVFSPICSEAVQRIDALFDIERDINGHEAEVRRTIRQALSAPLAAELHE